MAIDSSIYQNLRPVEMPSPMDSAQKAMSLSQLGYQQMQQQRAMQDQQAIRDAYTKNVSQDGTVNKQGVLSDLAKSSPSAMMQIQEHFNKTGKDEAEAQSTKMEAVKKIVGQTLPSMQYLAGLPESERAQAYPEVMQKLASDGVPTNNIPKDQFGNYIYDPGHFRQSFSILQNTAENLANQKTKTEIGKNISDINEAPIKRNAELYGSRSPNAELTSQYDKQAAPIRSSQLAMQQMIDNYKNPSPQGDASLILNAFKIKFPTAPDVNSLKELSESQSASDSWKNMAHQALEGGLDSGTRDNLMRDGVSTFRANVDSLRGIQDKFQSRSKAQNVSDPTLTMEPAIDKTFEDAMALQKKVGPYVPPSDRGGAMAGINQAISSIVGSGKSGNSNNNSSSIIPEANAGNGKGRAPTPPPGVSSDSVLMKSPNGKLKWISKSDYGEAIAGGGSVVK